MQFLHRHLGRDGDGDGRRSPHDLDDSAAAAATYLCSGSGSLLDPSARAAAIYRYNQDDYYVALVQAFEVGYRTGVFVIPSPPVDEDEATLYQALIDQLPGLSIISVGHRSSLKRFHARHVRIENGQLVEQAVVA